MRTADPAVRSDRFLLAFMALAVLSGLGVGFARVATAVYAMEIGANSAEMGMIASVQSIGLIVMGVPMGMLLETVSPRRLFAFGSATAGAIYLAVPFVRATWFLIVCTALVSFCLPSRFVSLNAVFFRHLEALGAAKAGWFRGSQMVGVFLLGPSLAGALVTKLDFTVTFPLVGLSFLGSVLLGRSVLSDAPEPHGGAGAARFSARAFAAQLKVLGASRPLRDSSLLEMSAQATLMYFTFFIVPIAVTRFRFSSVEAAALISAQGLCFIVALFTLGGLLESLGQRRGYLAGLAVSGLALCLLGAASRSAVLWAGTALLGLGLGMLQVTNLTRILQVSAELGRGRVAGVTSLTGPSGGLLGSLVGGVLSQRIGMQGVFLLLVPVFVVFSWVFYSRSEA